MLVLWLSLCLATSFLLSGMETGLFALNRLRLRQQVRAGNRRARALQGYLEAPENFLWTILVGNTLANLTAFSIVVMTLHGWLGHAPILFWLLLLVAVLSFYALFELFPKMLFRLYPNRLCMWMAVPFRLVDLVLGPLVAAMAFFSRGLMRWSGGKRFTGHVFGNRDELRSFMKESSQGLSSEERVMISRVLDLQRLTVQRVALPMQKVVSAPAHAPVAELLALCRERGYSRIPLWQEGKEGRRTVGLFSLMPWLYEGARGGERKAEECMEKALFLDGGMRMDEALRRMQRAGERLAIVRAADQTELGVVSLEDILKFMFGEVSL